MIVREHENSFILIQQHHHGLLAEKLIDYWKYTMFPEDRWRDSILIAIKNHDVGWAPFDEQPFWNDKDSAPFSFVDFPVLPKTVLYRQGIDDVEKLDAYAAMLCSWHYEQFIQTSDEKEAKKFVEDEQLRRKKLAKQVNGFDQELFKQHYALLQLADNFSLYCCLNDPGVDKQQEHPFFRNGIPSSTIFPELPKEKIAIHFKNDNTIVVENFPFRNSFAIEIKQKNVSKKVIDEKGVSEAYENAPYEITELFISPE